MGVGTGGRRGCVCSVGRLGAGDVALGSAFAALSLQVESGRDPIYGIDGYVLLGLVLILEIPIYYEAGLDEREEGEEDRTADEGLEDGAG